MSHVDDATSAAASALWSMYGTDSQTPADFLEVARVAVAAAAPHLTADLESAAARVRALCDEWEHTALSGRVKRIVLAALDGGAA